MRARPLFLAMILATAAAVATAAPPLRPLAERLDPQQMRETGLDQLTPAQLALLDRILADEAASLPPPVATPAVAAAPPRPARGTSFLRESRQDVATRIVGDFRGWRSGQPFTLENGETWRVVETSEYYLPRSKTVASPAVVLVPGVAGATYLRVEGHTPRAKVQRIR